MKRFAMLALVLLGALTLAGAAGADRGGRGDEDGGGGNGGGRTFGPYTIVTTDGGSCGNSWANDVIRRSYSVRSNGDGTYTVFETDIGSFTTIAGPSPGACEPDSAHGTLVGLGARGGLAGYLTGTVSCTPGPCMVNSTGVAAACPSSASPCTRDVFVAAAFGPTGRWSCLTGSDPCRFRFDYVAQDQGLIYHHWIDEGTASSEHFSGDIANA